jgi:hypothetical protein
MRHEILDDPLRRVLSNFNELVPQIRILPVANVNGVVTAGAWLASRRGGLERTTGPDKLAGRVDTEDRARRVVKRLLFRTRIPCCPFREVVRLIVAVRLILPPEVLVKLRVVRHIHQSSRPEAVVSVFPASVFRLL